MPKSLSAVIRGYEKCLEGKCDECPYHVPEGCKKDHMDDDALYYLHEYFAQQDELQKDINYWRQMDEDVTKLAEKLRPMVYNPERTELVKCRECKYYTEDVFLQAGAISFIAGHHMCSKWGRGCQTDPEGFCHMGVKM